MPQDGAKRQAQPPRRAVGETQEQATRARHQPAGRAPARGPSLLAQAAILAATLATATLLAELAGAANLGEALGVGQIAFALVLVALLLRS